MNLKRDKPFVSVHRFRVRDKDKIEDPKSS